MPTHPASELEKLKSARAGDSGAFDALVEAHRKPLLVHSYRMSGSLDDAEDIVQETFIRAWEKLTSFEGQGSFRNWLYVIATRLWLDEYRRRKKRILLPIEGDPADPGVPPQPQTSAAHLDPLPGSWLTGTDSSPEFTHERRESVSLAFMVALQQLNPHQRVVLILREVFAWSAQEVAVALGLTVDSVNNHLYRARRSLKDVAFEAEAPAKELDQFVSAWESGDVHGLIQLLHTNATFAMPPMGVWYKGRDSIGLALQNFVFMPGVTWKLVPASANGGRAFGIYRGEGTSFRAFGLLLPIFTEGALVEVTAFLSPQLLERFGLPETQDP